MKKSLKTLAMWLILGIIVVVSISSIMDNSQNKMKYSDLMLSVESGEIQNITLSSDGAKAYVTLKDDRFQEKEVNIPSIDSFMDEINPYLLEGSFTLEEQSESTIITIFRLLIPLGIIMNFFIFWLLIIEKKQDGAGNKNMSSDKSRAKMMETTEERKIAFDDLEGIDEEKE